MVIIAGTVSYTYANLVVMINALIRSQSAEMAASMKFSAKLDYGLTTGVFFSIFANACQINRFLKLDKGFYSRLQ